MLSLTTVKVLVEAIINTVPAGTVTLSVVAPYTGVVSLEKWKSSVAFTSLTKDSGNTSVTDAEVVPTEAARATGVKTLRVQIASRSDMPLRRVFPTPHLIVVMVASLHFHARSLLLFITFHDPKNIPIILQFYYIMEIMLTK